MVRDIASPVSLGPVISRSLPLPTRVPDFSHMPVEGKK